MASTIWSGVKLCERSKSGSTFTSTVLGLPPNGGGDNSPGMDVKEALTYTFAKSCNSLLERVALLNTSCPTGSEDASKRIINGGCDPGGKAAWILLDKALSSAAACAIFVSS